MISHKRQRCGFTFHAPVNISKLTSENSRYAVWYGGSLLASLVRTSFHFHRLTPYNSFAALRSLNSTTAVTRRRNMTKLVLVFAGDTRSSAVRRSNIYSYWRLDLFTRSGASEMKTSCCRTVLRT